jgi:hypothetical protein
LLWYHIFIVISMHIAQDLIISLSSNTVYFILNIIVWMYVCMKAVISSRKGQEVYIELWDWDPGFPGVQNDDFLGR